MNELARIVEALLFLSPEPLDVERLADACEVVRGRGRGGARPPARALRRGLPRRGAARGGGRLHARHRPGGRARRPAAARQAAHAAAHPGAGRVPRDRRLPPAGLAARDRAHPRRGLGVGGRHAARARADRGVGPLALRRGPLPHHRAVPEAVRPQRRSTRCPTSRGSTPRPRTRASCASACCGRASSAPPASCVPSFLPAPRRPRSCWRRFPGRERVDGERVRAHLRRRARPRRHPGGARRARRGRARGHLLPGRRAGDASTARSPARWPTRGHEVALHGFEHARARRAARARGARRPGPRARHDRGGHRRAAALFRPPYGRFSEASYEACRRPRPRAGLLVGVGDGLGADPGRADRGPRDPRPGRRARSCCCTTRRATPPRRSAAPTAEAVPASPRRPGGRPRARARRQLAAARPTGYRSGTQT